MNFRKKRKTPPFGEASFLTTRRKLTAIVVLWKCDGRVGLCTQLSNLRIPQLLLSRQLFLSQPHHTVPLLFQRCLLTLLRKWRNLSYSFCSVSISYSLQLDKSSLTYLPDICQVTSVFGVSQFGNASSPKKFQLCKKRKPHLSVGLPFGGYLLGWRCIAEWRLR